MTLIDPNAPAYPYTPEGNIATAHSGLTIRMEFAKAAMQGFCASPHAKDKWSRNEIAIMAIEQADSLIRELNRYT